MTRKLSEGRKRKLPKKPQTFKPLFICSSDFLNTAIYSCRIFRCSRRNFLCQSLTVRRVRVDEIFFRMYRIGKFRPVSRLVSQSKRQITKISGAYLERLDAQTLAHGVYSESSRDQLWKDLTDPTIPLPKRNILSNLLLNYRRSFLRNDHPVEMIMSDFEELSSQRQG